MDVCSRDFPSSAGLCVNGSIMFLRGEPSSPEARRSEAIATDNAACNVSTQLPKEETVATKSSMDDDGWRTPTGLCCDCAVRPSQSAAKKTSPHVASCLFCFWCRFCLFGYVWCLSCVLYVCMYVCMYVCRFIDIRMHSSIYTEKHKRAY